MNLKFTTKYSGQYLAYILIHKTFLLYSVVLQLTLIYLKKLILYLSFHASQVYNI